MNSYFLLDMNVTTPSNVENTVGKERKKVRLSFHGRYFGQLAS
jgi:hypothetical protein